MVRRLAAGGRWIRTFGPPSGTASFEAAVRAFRPPPRERSSIRPKGEAVSGRVTWALQRLQPGNEPPRLPSASEARPRQEGGHEQLSNKRAQEHADEAVDGGSEGQIELQCVSAPNRDPTPNVGKASESRANRWREGVPIDAGRDPALGSISVAISESYGEFHQPGSRLGAGLQQSALPRPFVGKGSDKNSGDRLSGYRQSIMELKSGDPRHLYFCNQTGHAATPFRV
jgi:hypothetical protein